MKTLKTTVGTVRAIDSTDFPLTETVMRDVIYIKTGKGELAITQRTGELPSDVRMVLLLVNGVRDVGKLQILSEYLKESIAPLIFLEDNGYIARTRASPTTSYGGSAAPHRLVGGATVSMASAHPLQASRAVYQQPQQQPQQQQPPRMLHAAPAPQAEYAESMAIQDVRLTNQVAVLTAYVMRVLGDDSGPIVLRLREINQEQDYQRLVAKLYDIIKSYRGGKEAERFASEFRQ